MDPWGVAENIVAATAGGLMDAGFGEAVDVRLLPRIAAVLGVDIEGVDPRGFAGGDADQDCARRGE